MSLIKLSPIAETCGVEERQLTHESYSVAAAPTKDHANSSGKVSGGLLATLLDDTMARYLAHVLGVQSMMTLSLTVHYLSAVHVGNILAISVRISRKGDKISYAEGTIECGGNVVAQAIGTFGHAGPRFRNLGEHAGEKSEQASAVGLNA